MSCGRGMASTSSSLLTSTSDESWFSELSEMMELTESSELSPLLMTDAHQVGVLAVLPGHMKCDDLSKCVNLINITLLFNMKTNFDSGWSIIKQINSCQYSEEKNYSPE